ncbi:MAG: nucleotide exchange factor GrpE, partial [Zoogloea sp.]|nr:nucleotide exchange factor GrpE [Zoogloea sp.]
MVKLPVSEDDMKGKVVEVLQKGYYLRDKVI